MSELKDKVAAVTGAASGIGLATTEAMIAAGATVVLVDRDEKALEAVAQRLGKKTIPLVIDLLNPASCASLLDGILKMAGQLDIFHANAGTYIGGEYKLVTTFVLLLLILMLRPYGLLGTGEIERL